MLRARDAAVLAVVIEEIQWRQRPSATGPVACAYANWVEALSGEIGA